MLYSRYDVQKFNELPAPYLVILLSFYLLGIAILSFLLEIMYMSSKNCKYDLIPFYKFLKPYGGVYELHVSSTCEFQIFERRDWEYVHYCKVCNN